MTSDSKKKILVVDDDDELLSLVEKKLRSEDYDVVIAKTGQESIELAKKELPDLILMDIVLTDIDGPEAVKSLRNQVSTKDIPVVFLSGIVSKEDDSIPGVNVGGIKYKALGKPFSPQELLDAVALALN